MVHTRRLYCQDPRIEVGHPYEAPYGGRPLLWWSYRWLGSARREAASASACPLSASTWLGRTILARDYAADVPRRILDYAGVVLQAFPFRERRRKASQDRNDPSSNLLFSLLYALEFGLFRHL